jgi:hypothetical protein
MQMTSFNTRSYRLIIGQLQLSLFYYYYYYDRHHRCLLYVGYPHTYSRDKPCT